MRKIKSLLAIMLLATVATLCAPQAFADGTAESPGITVTTEVSGDGTAESPGITLTADGTAESPGITFIILDLLSAIF
ncbi:MAG: hypothetical protein WCF57_22705 [Pyrinomonadaceae bacterium]